MLHGFSKLLGAGPAICRHAGRTPATRAALRHYCMAQPCDASPTRNYALPNPTWSPATRRIYDQYMKLSQSGGWRPLPSFNSSVHHVEGKPIESGRNGRRLFTRNLDQDGVGFEYCMFYNKAEKRTVCIFQPGPYLEGPPGYTHGGCIATIIDATIGTAAVYYCGSVMTANLNIDYKNPVPLGSTVVIDGRVDKIEGRKVYTSCQVWSHDDAVLHTEATGLFIRVNLEHVEAAERAAPASRPLEGSRL